MFEVQLCMLFISMAPAMKMLLYIYSIPVIVAMYTCMRDKNVWSAAVLFISMAPAMKMQLFV